MSRPDEISRVTTTLHGFGDIGSIALQARSLVPLGGRRAGACAHAFGRGAGGAGVLGCTQARCPLVSALSSGVSALSSGRFSVLTSGRFFFFFFFSATESPFDSIDAQEAAAPRHPKPAL